MIKVGQDLVCIGCVGSLGTQKIIENRRDELSKRFSRAYLDAVAMQSVGNRAFSGGECTDAETVCAQMGVTERYPVGRGGVLAALWNFCASAGLDPESGKRKNPGMGCEYRQDQIPVLQGTIELCELYELNPYRLSSENCWLAAADNGGRLAARLKEAGYQAAVIGTVTPGKTRARIDGEEIAYLTRSQKDELEKMHF